jgi:transcription initiation factor TFIIE subunit alpha
MSGSGNGTHAPQVTVFIQDGSKVAAEKLAEEEAERERKKLQNALPSWHQQSTIVSFAGASDGDKSAVPQSGAGADASAVTEVVVGADTEHENVRATDSTAADIDEVEDADIMNYYDKYYAAYEDDLDDAGDDEFIEVGMESKTLPAATDVEVGIPVPSADDDDEDEFIEVTMPDVRDGKRKRESDEE